MFNYFFVGIELTHQLVVERHLLVSPVGEVCQVGIVLGPSRALFATAAAFPI